MKIDDKCIRETFNQGWIAKKNSKCDFGDFLRETKKGTYVHSTFNCSERPNQQKSIPEASAMSTEASAEALAESLHKKMGQNDTKMGNFHQKFAL